MVRSHRLGATLFAVLLFAVQPNASVAAARPAVHGLTCKPDEKAWLTTTLFFGRSIKAGGTVSDLDWLSFLSAQIVPRFPDGFTVADAQGFWRGADGGTKVERSKMLIIAHPPGDSVESRFDEIIDAYKKRFSQNSVLKTVASTCIRF